MWEREALAEDYLFNRRAMKNPKKIWEKLALELVSGEKRPTTVPKFPTEMDFARLGSKRRVATETAQFG